MTQYLSGSASARHEGFLSLRETIRSVDTYIMMGAPITLSALEAAGKDQDVRKTDEH